MMKTLKKILQASLALICVGICTLTLTACGSAPTYYGKTLTLSGAANTIDWDFKENVLNNDGSWRQISYRERLTQDFENIDFDYVADQSLPHAWSEVGKNFHNAEDLIQYLDAHLGEIFATVKDTSFAFGDADSRSLVITSANNQQLSGIYVETYAQFQTLKDAGKIDEHCDYLRYLTNQSFLENPGRNCYGLFDVDNDGVYESYAIIGYTQYLVNGEARTLEYEVNVFTHQEVDIMGNVQYFYRTFTSRDMGRVLTLFLRNVDAETPYAEICLPLYPTVTVA